MLFCMLSSRIYTISIPCAGKKPLKLVWRSFEIDIFNVVTSIMATWKNIDGRGGGYLCMIDRCILFFDYNPHHSKIRQVNATSHHSAPVKQHFCRCDLKIFQI